MENGSLSEINDYLHIVNGNGNHNFILTEYGSGLNIRSNESLKIISKGNNKLDIEIENNKPQTQLSLLFDENNDSLLDEYNKVKYWFNLNATNNKLKPKFKKSGISRQNLIQSNLLSLS